jgi:hypothetical protein
MTGRDHFVASVGKRGAGMLEVVPHRSFALVAQGKHLVEILECHFEATTGFTVRALACSALKRVLVNEILHDVC